VRGDLFYRTIVLTFSDKDAKVNRLSKQWMCGSGGWMA